LIKTEAPQRHASSVAKIFIREKGRAFSRSINKGNGFGDLRPLNRIGKI